MPLQILTAKDYMKLFNVSIRTAKRMIAEDRRHFDSLRINTRQLSERHCLLPEDLRAITGE